MPCTERPKQDDSKSSQVRQTGVHPISCAWRPVRRAPRIITFSSRTNAKFVTETVASFDPEVDYPGRRSCDSHDAGFVVSFSVLRLYSAQPLIHFSFLYCLCCRKGFVYRRSKILCNRRWCENTSHDTFWTRAKVMESRVLKCSKQVSTQSHARGDLQDVHRK